MNSVSDVKVKYIIHELIHHHLLYCTFTEKSAMNTATRLIPRLFRIAPSFLTWLRCNEDKLLCRHWSLVAAGSMQAKDEDEE